MNKLKHVLLIPALLVILFGNSGCTYNSIVEKEEHVESKWAQVENVYQRRADLIPNLVETVKGYADFEKETLQSVIEARAEASGVNVKADELNQENIQKFQQAQSELSGALSRLMMRVERYPDLKANQNFLELQSQLEGTENRIAVERKKFNDAVRDYNTYIKKFPNNMIAGMFEFQKKGYFQADEGSDEVPDVDFGSSSAGNNEQQNQGSPPKAQ